MACRWMHDPKIGKWWYPQCIGGIYGKEGCTCRRGAKVEKAQIERLEKRLDEMERQWLKLTNSR